MKAAELILGFLLALGLVYWVAVFILSVATW